MRFAHGSIVGFDHSVQFRVLKGDKFMSLLNRARNDGCGQPCLLRYTRIWNAKTWFERSF